VALDTDFVRAVREHFADLGFDHVTLDLEGYATGSVSPGETSVDADDPEQVTD
jgi:PP-loop superfamily ATP-utilizing enzyme